MKEVFICTKSRYASEKMALIDIKRFAKESTRKEIPIRAYHCDKCNSWHLTSRPDIDFLVNENKNLKEELEKRINEVRTLNKTIITFENRKINSEKMEEQDNRIKKLIHLNLSINKELKDLKQLWFYRFLYWVGYYK